MTVEVLLVLSVFALATRPVIAAIAILLLRRWGGATVAEAATALQQLLPTVRRSTRL